LRRFRIRQAALPAAWITPAISGVFITRAGYQTFDENMTLNEVASGETSINPVALSQSQPLAQLSWSQSRRLKTPISEFSLLGRSTCGSSGEAAMSTTGIMAGRAG
jgi:hypothetical protein